jgi:hypothetical protein
MQLCRFGAVVLGLIGGSVAAVSSFLRVSQSRELCSAYFEFTDITGFDEKR